jgi:hypothetical protein
MNEPGLAPTWQSEQCHRSALAGPARPARAIEQADERTSVTFLHLACSGATINDGLLGSYAGIEPGARLPPQVTAARSGHVRAFGGASRRHCRADPELRRVSIQNEESTKITRSGAGRRGRRRRCRLGVRVGLAISEVGSPTAPKRTARGSWQLLRRRGRPASGA